MAEYVIAKKDDIVAIADSIRTKTGLTAKLSLNEMVTEIASISGGGGGTPTLSVTTISDVNWNESITLPELIGAKYFIIKGNHLTGENVSKLNLISDVEALHTLIYLNGLAFVYYVEKVYNSQCNMACAEEMNNVFDSTTGTVYFNNIAYFNRLSTDTSSGDTVYTVYRLG